MLSIKQIADILHWESPQNVAYGYTFDRQSVLVKYDDSMIIRYNRLTRPSEGDVKWETVIFNEWNAREIFVDNIKRWYQNCIDQNLISLCSGFGLDLPVTPGGHWEYVEKEIASA